MAGKCPASESDALLGVRGFLPCLLEIAFTLADALKNRLEASLFGRASAIAF
jgi:hypothetical protein